MSDKTETLSFDDALNEHKRLLTESLVSFDEGQRVRKIMLDIDSNSSDYEYYFQSGQQSKQGEVDKLQTEVDKLQTEVDKLQTEVDKLQTEVDELKKRIYDALGAIEDNHLNHIDTLLLIIDVLKGDQS